jgi:uncharacterized protein YcfL
MKTFYLTSILLLVLSGCASTKYVDNNFEERLSEKAELTVSSQSTNLVLEKKYTNRFLDVISFGFFGTSNVTLNVHVKYEFYYDMSDTGSYSISSDADKKTITIKLPPLKYKILHIKQNEIVATVDGLSLSKDADIKDFMESYFDKELSEKGEYFLKKKDIIKLSRESFKTSIQMLKPNDDWTLTIAA